MCSDHAPFRDSLSSIGWDLLWSTCAPNLKSLCSPIIKIRKAMQNVEFGVFGKLGVRGHPRSPAMSAFDRVTSHSTLTETMHLPSTIFKLTKVTHFNLSHPHLMSTLGLTACEFWQDLWHQRNYSPLAIMWHCLHDPMFSRFDTIPACDRQTHNDSIYHTSIASCSKNE